MSNASAQEVESRAEAATLTQQVENWMGGPSSLNWQLYRQQKLGKAQHKRVVYGVVQRAFLVAAPSFQWAVSWLYERPCP